MPAGVQGGSLGRWFEQLCRIKIKPLAVTARDNRRSLLPKAISSKGGVYVFWWTGPHELLESQECNRELGLHGPGGRIVRLLIDDHWLGLETGLPIPLYVGKTADNLSKRVGLHLKLGSQRLLKLGKQAIKQKAPTTSCQLRAGIEHLFPYVEDTRTLVLDNVGLSFVELNGDEHAADRFYLEDLAIGLMRPPLNVDVER